MKTGKLKYELVMLIVGLVFVSCATTRKGASDDRINTIVNQQLASGNYRIEVNKTFGIDGGIKHLLPGYYFEIWGDTAFCHLPFYGRAYSAPANMSGGGIDFRSQMLNFSKDVNAKKRIAIRFDVRIPGEAYRVNLFVWPDGHAEINIAPNTRSISRYLGQLSEVEKL